MLSLVSFHVFFITIAVVLMAGLALWGLFSHQLLIGAIALACATLLIVYEVYFTARARRAHLD